MEEKQKTKLIAAILFAIPVLILLYLNLQTIVDYFTYKLFGMDAKSHLGASVNFFFFDAMKIMILIFGISAVMGVVNAYFPVEKLREHLTTKKMYGFQYLFASAFGAVTPFCSCSSIPLFIGFVKGGIPLGVTLAYLITSPLVNEVAVAMFLGLFGLKVTLIYAVSGILLGTIGGYILGKFGLDKYLANWVLQIQKNSAEENVQWEMHKTSFVDRLPVIIADAWGIVRKVALFVLIGIAVGAAMHGYVPENFFTAYLSEDKWYAIPFAVLLAVPMYGSAVGIVPVIQVFVAKGVPMGTAIAFMMAVVGLSLPEATMLKKVMQWKLIGIFFGTITVFIIGLGYIFNIVL